MPDQEQAPQSLGAENAKKVELTPAQTLGLIARDIKKPAGNRVNPQNCPVCGQPKTSFQKR